MNHSIAIPALIAFFITLILGPGLIKFLHRLKLIWYAIRGKEYRLEDFVLDKNDINELISALQEVNCNK